MMKISQSPPAGLPSSVRSGRTLLLGLSLMCAFSAVCLADPIAIDDVQHVGPVDFEKEVLPILAKNCMACHSASNPESELVLETPQTIIKGGAQGPGVIPGKADESLLLLVASHREEPVMPPEGNTANAKNLTSRELGLIKLWIAQGAQGSVTGMGKAIEWQQLAADVNPILTVAVSADGRTVATGRGNQIDVYSVPARTRETRLVDAELAKHPSAQGRARAHLDLVQSLAFSPDGEWLASGSFREVKLWRRPQQFGERDLTGFQGTAKAVMLSPDRTQAALLEASDRIRLYNLASGVVGAELKTAPGDVSAMAFTPGNRHLLTGGADKTIRLWDAADGRMVGAFLVPDAVTALSVSAPLKQIIVGSESGVVRLYALPEPTATIPDPISAGTATRELAGANQPVNQVVLANSEGTQVFAAGNDGIIRHWDLATGNLIRSFAHGAPVTALAVRGDTTQLATGSSHGSVKLWRSDNGTLVADLNEQPALLDQLDKAKLKIDLAQRELASRLIELNAADKKANAEQQSAYNTALDVAKAEVELKVKSAAFTTALENKSKADLELENQKKVLAAAEAKVKELESASPTAGDEAAKKAHAEMVTKAQAEVTAAKGKVDAAEKEATKVTTALTKAQDQKTIASQAVDASRRTLQGMTETATRSRSALPEFHSRLVEQEAAVTDAQIALAAVEKGERIRTKEVQDLRADLLALDQALFQLGPQLAATPASDAEKAAVAAGPKPEQVAARAAVLAADTAWRTSRGEQLESLEEKQAQVAAFTLKQAAADKAVNDATTRKNAAVAARDAAVKPVTDLGAKLAAATDDSGKIIGAIELQNATHRKQILEEAAARTQAILDAAVKAKAEVAKQLGQAQAELNALTQSLTAKVNEALAKRNAAIETCRAVDTAAGGNLAVLESVRQLRDAVSAALAEKIQPVTFLAFSPDGTRLLSSDTLNARLYATLNGEPIRTAPLGNGGLQSGGFINDSEILTLHSKRESKHQLKILETLPAWQLARRLGDPASTTQFVDLVTALDFNPDGTLLATGGGEASRSGELKIWDMVTGNLVKTIDNAHSDVVFGLEFSPDGKLIASCGADRFMKVFNVESGALAKSFEGHTSHVLGVSWRSDGRLLATTSSDKSSKVWDLAKGEVSKSLAGYNREVTSVQYLGATDTFVTSTGLASQVMIRTSDGGNGAVFPGTTDFIYCVRASANGHVVAAGGQDSVLHVWNGQGVAIVKFPAP